MRITILVLSLLAAVLEGRAVGEPSSSPEELYAEGKTAYDRADYRAAIDRWQKSYVLSGENDLLFNIAQAYRLAGDCAIAILTYRQFITADPTVAQASLAENLIRELEPSCDTRYLKTPETPSPESSMQPHRGRHLKITGLVTGGIGVITLASGFLFGRRAETIGQEVTSTCAISCDWSVQRSRESAGRRSATIGYALDAIGGAALVAGALMYYFGQRESAITVAPISPQRDGRGATVSWNTSW